TRAATMCGMPTALSGTLLGSKPKRGLTCCGTCMAAGGGLTAAGGTASAGGGGAGGGGGAATGGGGGAGAWPGAPALKVPYPCSVPPVYPGKAPCCAAAIGSRLARKSWLTGIVPLQLLSPELVLRKGAVRHHGRRGNWRSGDRGWGRSGRR